MKIRVGKFDFEPVINPDGNVLLLLLLFFLAASSAASVLWLASVSFALAVASAPLTSALLAAVFYRRLRSALGEQGILSHGSAGARKLALLRDVATAGRTLQGEDGARQKLSRFEQGLAIEKDRQEFITGCVQEANSADNDHWEIGLEQNSARADRGQRRGAAPPRFQDER